MSNNTNWELRAKVAGELVDLQAAALKKALVETDEGKREVWLETSRLAEEAFLNVVPEARQAIAEGIMLETLVPEAMLNFSRELEREVANEKGVVEAEQRNTPHQKETIQQRLGQIQGLEWAAQRARAKANR